MKILAVSPHSDDVELGCGGTLVRLLEREHEVRVQVFSYGNPRSGANKDELNAAMEVLGIETVDCWAYDCRQFTEFRQEILQHLTMQRLNYNPDLVFVPSTANIHQDHEVVTAEAMRAFRTSSILGYEMPWGDVRPFSSQFYMKLKANHIILKIEALRQYDSQCQRPYMNPDLIWHQAKQRGMQIGQDYAEAFEVIRWVM